jgi:hypothetical protein
MTLNANALTTLSFAKDFLKIPSAETSMDSMVEHWINAASQFIETRTDRKLKAQSIIEYQSGRKSNCILTREYPINSISEIKVDSSGLFTDPNTIIESSNYGIGEEACYVIGRDILFPVGHRNIKITYNGGFSTIPTDLIDATCWLIAQYRMIRDSGDIGRPQRGKGDESSTILQTAPQYVLDIINSYKRWEFAISPRDIRNE